MCFKQMRFCSSSQVLELDGGTSVSYLAESCFLAELGDGLIELRLLLREVLLVESEQLLALFVLLLHACRTRGQGDCAVSKSIERNRAEP